MRVERPSGLSDRLPGEAQALRACQGRLQGVLASFGYQEVDTPVLEYVDLFLAKAGPAPGVRLYTLEQGGRRLCLRPEFTASIARLFVEHLQEWPKPVRLQFAGPAFRLETPQRGRFRQFTLVGAELLGAEGPAADAEVLALACTALEEVGVRGYRVVLGHVGLVQQVLQGLGLSPRGQQFVLRHMESLRKPHLGRAHVERLLEALYPPAPPAAEATPQAGQAPTNGAAADLLAGTLVSQGVFLGSRSPHEVAARLGEKRQVAREREAIRRALDLVEDLGTAAGPLAQAVPRARECLRGQGAALQSLDALEATADLFAAYGLPRERLRLDLGMARGVRYYTGLVFEVHAADAPGGDSQLCGGGRYDDLVREVGSRQPVPAAGFALGLERVVAACQQHPPHPSTPDVLVIPVQPDDVAYAVRVAQLLRTQAHLQVELQVKAHLGPGPSLRLADRRGIPVAVIVGGQEQAEGTAVL
ncbi:MAG: ATP phosphoribosyltransferase regulatory subunit, partial [Anaerolineae bacterium]|nr:ATP phosphoribosyltransferase regulatory subunit [Anaerolineae bacterium]